ncbi:MAG: IS21 family transposase, partial [Actinobacteria bacterium]|nr:IS21 family transposase [Actinomycetota bacterium]
SLARSEDRDREAAVVSVQEWAEIRAMKVVGGLSIKEIVRRTGRSRNTVRAALRAPEPPSYGPRSPRPSKLDPFKAEIHELLRDSEGRVPSQVIRERVTEAGYRGSKTICDDYVRELRPVFCPPRTSSAPTTSPELVQFDLWEPSAEIPVGHGQLRRGYVITCCSGYSRAGAGTLVFSKSAPDVLWGMSRCLAQLGALPRKAVWDREGAIHAGGGQPTDEFAALCGQLGLGWVILDPGDCQAKGMLERLHDFIERSFEPARRFANELDYQDQLDRWFAERANARVHRTLRAVPAERLEEERALMRELPDPMPDLDRRWVIRVPAQPYLRFDTNDYSLDPRLAGRRVEVRASQRELMAVALDTGELACRHRRSFARHLTFTGPAHQRELDRLRGERKRRRREPEVELRPLARYDALIPA